MHLRLQVCPLYHRLPLLYIHHHVDPLLIYLPKHMAPAQIVDHLPHRTLNHIGWSKVAEQYF